MLLLAYAACGPAPGPAVRAVELGGAWEVRAETDSSWTPATVPGTVHTDLLAAGRIPEPLTGDREAELAWIEDAPWLYRRTFDVPPSLLDESRVELVFEGLDGFATVTLNGTVVLEADNQFRTWRIDVGRTVRAGTNRLEVRFDPPVREGRARAEAHPWPIPHQEPDAGATRAFTRKAAYQFGWDWGPRFVTSGIWRPARLEAWSGVRIRDAWIGPPQWNGDTAKVRVHVEMEAADSGAVRVGVRSPAGAFEHVLEKVPSPWVGAPSVFSTTLTIPHAERWWPRGVGEPAGRLYDLDVDVVQGRTWDRVHRRVGLRSIELVADSDAVGESFRFEVNGRPVFARGANVVPPDHFPSRVDSAGWARLVDDAVAANMNMVRVWGGGVYPPDVFYDLADARGVMVWQDFMFANTLVPGDSAFVASVEAEAHDQAARLRRHPSLALWCGNNEIAEGSANWGWREEYAPEVAERVEAAYRRVFDDVLPAVLASERIEVGYVPSSPRIGWGRPESLTMGDSHYWGVWWGMEPFRVYARKVPRFASEFGFQALPAPATIAAFGDPPPTRLDHPIMRAHQKHATGYETIRAYLERDWPVPPADSLDAWSYASQLAQAEGVGLALEAHRRNWPATGGTLFWQLNDTWPVTSWSSVDAFGRWKALQHEARRIFAPVAVLADAWADTVAVWVAADGALRGTLELRALDFEGREVAAVDAFVGAGGDRSLLAWRGTAAQLLPRGTDPGRVVVVARLRADGEVLAEDHVFLVAPKTLALPDPGLRVVSATRSGDGWDVTITADGFARAVRIGVEGAGARVVPNWMDVLPGDTVRVRVVPEAPIDDLGARLRLRSFADLRGRR